MANLPLKPLKAEHIYLEEVLLERKHVSDFEQVLKEIDFNKNILILDAVFMTPNLKGRL